MLDDDNDFDHQKRSRQMKEHGEYDAPDEEDRAIIRNEDEEEDNDSESGREAEPNASRNGSNDAADEDDSGRLELGDMQQINPNLVNFAFDREHGQWCEIELEVIYPSY